MRHFRDLPIQRKLRMLVTLASSVALLLSCSAFVAFELWLIRSTISRELATIGQIVSDSSTAAVAFSDARAAQETLAMLRGEPRIMTARVYAHDGTVFAGYRRPDVQEADPGPPRKDGMYFTDRYVELYRGIVLESERLGTIYLRSDLAEVNALVVRSAGIGMVVLLASLLVALLVSSVTQRAISKPVMNLAETVSLVSNDSNYSIRAVKSGDDELGVLVDRFNEMMAQINARDVALQNARDELEERVKARTTQLEAEIVERTRIEQDLVAAKETAEESNQAKSAFLANMSHELRTPLNAIIGYAELLEEEAQDAGENGTIADLRKIGASGKHLLTLINDVLDLSKIEAGRMEVCLEPVQIASVMDEVANTLEPLARKNRNKLVLQRNGGEGAMYADPTKFRQTLLNLLSNAFKFTENGTVTLSVRRERAGGREWVLWKVTDTGIGISSEQMPKLFRPFSQLDASATRKYGGTGLGLAISRRLCQMMDGEITVASQPGKGSAFTIRIPADAVPAAGTPPDLRETGDLSLRQLEKALVTSETGAEPDLSPVAFPVRQARG